MSCWIRLGIEPTKDQNTIRGAYRAALPAHHPETDPEGFQALREAYESALRHAREEDRAPSQATEAAPQPGILDEFRDLLDDSTRRYDPQAWRNFIRQLDLLPLEALEDASWSLLQAVRSCGMISRDCVRILANRLAWSQQLLRLDFDAAREIEGFLDHLETPDPFPTALMGTWPAIVQQEVLWYLNTLDYFHIQRPLFEYAGFANAHVCLPLPADDALLQRLLVQFAQAEVASPCLYQWCAEQQAAQPDDVDLLYLLAQHATILGKVPEALASWTRLHWEYQHPDAPRRLIELFHGQRPEYVPLLIQALDWQQDAESWPQSLNEQVQLYGSFAQSPQTLSRWFVARHSQLDGLAAAFVDWRLDSSAELPLLALLLDEHPQPALQRLYRYAWALPRGDNALLREISEAPASEDLLEEIILKEFRRQAAQHLRWLSKAAVPLVMSGCLEHEDRYPEFPPSLGEDFGPLACRNWLRRMRAYDRRALERIFENFAVRQMQPAPFALDHQARLANRGLELAPPDDATDPWQWHAQGLFVLALLEKPEDWLGLITPSMLRNIEYPDGHPFARTRDLLLQWLESKTSADRLLVRLDHSNPLQALLAEELCTLESVLDGTRLPRHGLLLKTFANDREAFGNDLYSMTLFWSALFLNPRFGDEERRYLFEQVSSVTIDDPWFAQMREHLQSRHVLRPRREVLQAQGIDCDSFFLALDTLGRLALGKWPAPRVLATLQMAKDDAANSNGLRLALTAVLSLADRFMEANTTQEHLPAWAFWKTDSRLSRRDYALMLAFWAGLGACVPFMASELQPLSALCIIGGTATTGVRRLRDRGHGFLTVLGLLLVSPAIPLCMLAFLLLPGDILANRFGPPANPADRQRLLTDGLQAALRRLKPKRRARPAIVSEPGDGW